MTDYIQVTFPGLQPEQMEILVAQLSEAGYEGFEETGTSLDAFISESGYDETILSELVFKYQLTYKKSFLKSKNWNQIWESGFEPVLVHDFVAIRAGFHPPVSGVKYEIVITPKMSFGTGHHATTYLMIEQMGEIDFTGKSVLDFGTGTGILSILSEKLGAAGIVALDNDPWSISNAKENIQQNNCSRILIRKKSKTGTGKKFDIILANINKNVILENIKNIAAILSTGGNFLISGILTEDKHEILTAARSLGLIVNKESVKTNWICLRFVNNTGDIVH